MSSLLWGQKLNENSHLLLRNGVLRDKHLPTFLQESPASNITISRPGLRTQDWARVEGQWYGERESQ
jgi:hypothetical protein